MTWWLNANLTLISDCEATTNWSGGSGIATNDSFNLEGTNCLGEKVNSNDGSDVPGSENVYTFAANIDMTSNFFVIPMSITGRASTLANGGYRIVVDDGNGDRFKWYVGGDDTTNERWTFFVLDPSTVPEYINGTANSAITHTSITRISATVGNIAASAHGLVVGDYIKVSGANEDGYNNDSAVIAGGDTNNIRYNLASDPGAGSSPATGTTVVYQICDYTDVDKVGVQMSVTTKAVGNTPNTFWDICWYGSGHVISSVRDAGASMTRSGTTVSFTTTTKLDENVDSSNITFTAPDTISDSNNGLGSFVEGDLIYVTGTTGGTNNGTYRVDTGGTGAGSITTVEQTITTQGTSSGTTSITRSHGMSNGDLMRVSGSTDSGYDGDYAVSNVDANKLTFDYTVPSAPTAASATGVMQQIVTWDLVANEDQANFYGLTATINGVIYIQGQFIFGSFGGVTVRDLLMVDAGKLLVFRENLFLEVTKNAFYFVRNTTSRYTTIEWTDIFVSANETSYSLITGGSTVTNAETPNDVHLTGVFFQKCLFINMGKATTGVTVDYDGCIFDSVDAIYPENRTVQNFQVKNNTSFGFIALEENAWDNVSDGTIENCNTGFSIIDIDFKDFDCDNVIFTNNTADVAYYFATGASSVSSIARTGDTALVTTAAVHGLIAGQYATIAGATPETEYNGVWEITATPSTTSFEYTITGEPNTPAGGTKTWEETAVWNNLNGSNAAIAFSPGGAGIVDFRTSVTATIASLTWGTPVKLIANETVGDVTSGDVLEQGFADSNGEFSATINYESAFEPSGLDIIVRARNQGVAVAAIADDGGVFTDETEAASTNATADMTLLPAAPALNDAYYFGHNEQFARLKLDISTAWSQTGYSLVWEYWNGTGWSDLSETDGTNSLANTGENIVSWTIPGNWATTTVNGVGPLYYVRLRVSAVGTNTTSPVGAKVQLDTTRYLPYTANRVITSSGLLDNAAWTPDTISKFSQT